VAPALSSTVTVLASSAASPQASPTPLSRRPLQPPPHGSACPSVEERADVGGLVAVGVGYAPPLINRSPTSVVHGRKLRVSSLLKGLWRDLDSETCWLGKQPQQPSLSAKSSNGILVFSGSQKSS